MIKRRFIFSLILCLIVGSVFGFWHVFRDKQQASSEEPEIYKTTPVAPRQNTKKNTARRVEQEQTKEPETLYSGFVDKNGDGVITHVDIHNPNLPVSHPENVRARLKLIIANLKNGYTIEELEKPEIKKFFELMESQGYFGLVLNGATQNELMNFLANNGLTELRDLDHQPFRQHFSMGIPADYEPEMRERLKSLIIENGGYDSGVLGAFLDSPGGFAWYKSQFLANLRLNDPKGQDLGRDWLKNVEDEALEGINASAQKSIETGMNQDMEDRQTSVVSPNTSTNTEPYQESLEPKMDDASDNSKRLSENSALPVELQQFPELSDVINQLSDALNEEDIKTAFRDQFSPERFNRALQTLNQYGTEEGLRRLKESDPEVAKRIERLLSKHQGLKK